MSCATPCDKWQRVPLALASLTQGPPAPPSRLRAGKYRTAAVTDEGDVYMWEGRSDYFPAEGRQPGSGSKKPGSASASRARPIPGRAGGGTRISLGSEAPLPGGSPGSADAPYGGSYGSHSHSRRAGSWIERFAREREAATSVGAVGSYGAGGSAGRVDVLGAGTGGSGSKPSRAGDTFERIHPERCGLRGSTAGFVAGHSRRAMQEAEGEALRPAWRHLCRQRGHGLPPISRPCAVRAPPRRVEGLKRVVAVAVGEKHSLAVQRWSAAQLDGMAHVPWLQAPLDAAAPAAAAEAAAAEEEAWFQQAVDGLVGSPGGDELRGVLAAAGAESPAAGLLSPARPSPMRPGPRRERGSGPALGPPSLQRICEEEVARRLVDPRTCLQVGPPAVTRRAARRSCLGQAGPVEILRAWHRQGVGSPVWAAVRPRWAGGWLPLLGAHHTGPPNPPPPPRPGPRIRRCGGCRDAARLLPVCGGVQPGCRAAGGGRGV